MEYKAIGIMSGTSLDGVDVCACTFTALNGNWTFEMHEARTYDLPDELMAKFQLAGTMSGLELAYLHVAYGGFIGDLVVNFLSESSFEPDFIASHGYTVFHEPAKGLSTQIGSGAEIAAKTGVKTICDFRTSDVALGGQGAPLVPIGDALLFGEYAACLNLGGFSNVSFDLNESRIAYDICPTNMLLNTLAQNLGKPFDKNGELGSQGKVLPELLHQLNDLSYYKQPFPKSLGREFFEEQVMPLLISDHNTPDLLRTAYEHIASQIANNLNRHCSGEVLVSGGGAHNNFLMELIKHKSKVGIVVPAPLTVDFKEALIFAFLGVLRIDEKPNCLKSVTGALRDNIGGAIYL